MSAAEIIEQIKALPAEEQSEVAEFVRELAAAKPQSHEVRYISVEEAKVIGDRIFENNAELFRKLAQ